MKLVCTQNDLSTNLSLVSRAVPSRPTHPVLANVKLEANKKTQLVSLTAFDLSLGIQTSFPAQVEEEGYLTLPAKLLNDIVSRLAEGEITLEDKGEEGTSEGIIATLTSASGRYKVRGMTAEEFPELPVIENGEAAQLPAAALIDGLRGSLFATSPDETKQVLTGIHLTVKPEYLEFAATDGHRLSVVETTNQGQTDEEPSEAISQAAPLEVTIPARALRELERILGMRQSAEAIALHLDQGQVVFELVDQRLTSRTLEGQYPAYRQLIPQQFERQVTIDRRQLLNALERIAVLADQKNNIVKFTIDSTNQQIALSVEAQDVGSGRESLPAQISGKDLEIAFNITYLRDGLKALQSSEIQMQMNTGNSPVILTPLGGLKMTYLVMPVQIRA
ncbi:MULTISPECIES: DNA polymerase III subunit beta [unclassified Coleofasciculus]|uniref:DNA polymerase III subunit beta n=1 Tax=Cyanophyceae TaxID=3028117 RepID=UPI001685281B|nr:MULTISPECIES: DNA polymerase III subunit beta [unclassified Coleofasciculus]MBD1837135.1 DNA polymerase III subunit beta [Coleofasciculus sp. FACHB-501]MBD1877455.1 DNA polymerase III subunit beta [Coleofasciculus sp. FACHB-T130]